MSNYFTEITKALGEGWDRFWFTPASPLPACVLRIAVGLAACWFFVGYCTDLTLWFGPNGLMPAEVAMQLQQARDGIVDETFHGPSLLFYFQQPAMLWTVHVIALACSAAMAVGFLSRGTTVATFMLVLSYVHRAPVLSGYMEPVLIFTLAYLCLAPTNRCLSVDNWLNTPAWFGKLFSRGASHAGIESSNESVAANISLRLIQTHLTIFYLMVGLSMAAGLTWWEGDAMWWVMARTESRLVDFTFLHSNNYVFNLWTHFVALYTLAFPILIWNRLARPIVLVVGVAYWVSLIPVTGLVSYCVLMLLANIAFAPESWLHFAVGARAGNSSTETSSPRSEKAAA